MTSSYEKILQDTASAISSSPVVTIGNFDGVHLGHQAIFSEIARSAREKNTVSVAISFEPHPVVFFGKKAEPEFRLTDPDHKIELMRACGIDHPVLLPFSRELAGLTPEAFIHKVLRDSLQACEVRVGYDFNFGKGRSGTVEDLKAIGASCGMDVHIHAAVEYDNGVVSSTRVRKALLAGDLEEAARLLTRPHSLRGSVLPGAQRGRKMGFPTANISPRAGMMVPHGVYTSHLRVLEGPDALSGRLFPSITNVGTRPTVSESGEANAETFVLGELSEGADLYGMRVEVVLGSFLRPEQKFPSQETLKAQVMQDLQAAREKHGLLS